jgi:ribokinase
VVALDHGTRNVFSRAAGPTGAHDHLPPDDVIEKSRALLIDHHGVKGAIRACRIARAAGVPIVADFERADHPQFPELLAAVDHLVISEAFARRLTGRDSAADAARELWNPQRSAVVVTCGVCGCWFTEAGGPASNFPAFPVEAKDTAGCGDVFHGAYVAGLAFGMDLRQRLELSSAAAALYASSAGEHRIPRRGDVRRLLTAAGSQSVCLCKKELPADLR